MTGRFAFKRSERVGELIKSEITDILAKRIKNPIFQSCLLTVIRVTVSDDLKHCVIHVSIMETGVIRTKVLRELKKASGFFRFELGKRLSMKTTPSVMFKLDKNTEYADRITQVLSEVVKHKDGQEGEENEQSC